MLSVIAASFPLMIAVYPRRRRVIAVRAGRPGNLHDTFAGARSGDRALHAPAAGKGRSRAGTGRALLRSDGRIHSGHGR
jgi:hypothetical protein